MWAAGRSLRLTTAKEVSLGEFAVLHVTFALAVLIAVIAIAATGAPYF